MSDPVPEHNHLVAEVRTLVLVENLRYLSAVASSLGIAVTDLAALVQMSVANSAPSDVARFLAITSASTTALCDRLEGAGLLRRRAHPGDRRRRVLHLTARGQRLAQRFGDLVAEDVNTALVEISRDEWPTVLKFLQAMRSSQAKRADELLALPMRERKLAAR